ncbi:hypothetical protein DFQ30_003199 [Apophysomyces sp. BC1015]|nr:hypothetical protein DFQ30_003199 [Apophysomyces sp. BC1015]
MATWNIGLQCYAEGHNGHGGNFLLLAYQLIHLQEIKDQMDDRHRICLFICTATRFLSKVEKKALDYVELLEAVTKFNDNMNTSGSEYADAITTLMSFFEIEAYIGLDRFDEALGRMKEMLDGNMSVDVYERLAGIVLQHENYSVNDVLQIIKPMFAMLQNSDAEEDVGRYAKWTRMFVSIAIYNDKTEAFSCLESVLRFMQRPGKNFPQNELYYLIVVAWNEGVTCFQ